MNDLQILRSNFGEIRGKTINGEPYCCLADVCKCLELDQVSRVKSRLREDGVTTSKVIDSLGREQEATFINESNLYKVIFQSRKPEAEKFTDWVTSEVLPQIRKTGGYHLPTTYKEAIANLLVSLEENEQLQAQIEVKDSVIAEMQPKVSYLDMILASKDTMLTTQIAADYDMSAKRFNQILKDLRIQHRVGDQWILYSEHQGNGYVSSKTSTFKHHDGSDGTNTLTVWTQKGRLFLYERLKSVGYVPTIEREAAV